jgi:hypothetical protein
VPGPVAIKVSAEFAESVRAAADSADRSLTGQIEHWAKLGRAAETVLPAPAAAALKQSAGNLAAIEDPALREQILTALEALRSGDHFPATRKHLASLGQPLYEADPADSQGIVQVGADGRRTRGRLVNRRFVPAE